MQIGGPIVAIVFSVPLLLWHIRKYIHHIYSLNNTNVTITVIFCPRNKPIIRQYFLFDVFQGGTTQWSWNLCLILNTTLLCFALLRGWMCLFVSCSCIRVICILAVNFLVFNVGYLLHISVLPTMYNFVNLYAFCTHVNIEHLAHVEHNWLN